MSPCSNCTKRVPRATGPDFCVEFCTPLPAQGLPECCEWEAAE